MLRSYYSFVDRFFDDSTKGLLSDAFNNFTHGKNLLSGVSLSEGNGEYCLEMAVPGMRREDVKVDLEENQLRVEARRKSQHDRWAFTRSFTMPGDADLNKIKAKCEHGLLTITFPKTSASRGRLIPVSGKDTGFAGAGGSTPWQKWKEKIKARFDDHRDNQKS